MGNKMSNPMSNESLDRVQVIITEVMANFTTEFAVHYKDAVVDSAKNKNPEIERETKGLMLPNLPIPDYALKCGVMYKKGVPLKFENFLVLISCTVFRRCEQRMED